MSVPKLFSWIRGGLVQGPGYGYYMLFWWLYTERTLRSKAAVSPYNRLRKLLLVKSGIVIGEGTEIGFGSFILGISRTPPSVTFGKRVAVAPYVVFVASSYPDNSRLAYHPEAKGLVQKTAPIVVEDDAWIGAHAVIFPGVTVGASAIVAAGAVVRQDVPPKSIVAGVPAKVIRTLD
ncbi:acyltransferase [Desulfuromonas acetoxidans]|uniref:acyltransferase n=1 Tax=Desulfuromonas acetoxidans TaxID=891 RepID=UPI002931043D|nr:acyltransferase [Desulfuromonas acetoxidans]